MTIASSKIKHLCAGVGLLSARTFQKGEVIGSYYETLVLHDLSPGEHTRKLWRCEVLKVDMFSFSTYTVQVQVQGSQFERVTARLENKDTISVVLASFCASAFINIFHYAKKDEKYS